MGCCALLQGILPTLGWDPRLLCLPALVARFFTTSATWEVLFYGQGSCKTGADVTRPTMVASQAEEEVGARFCVGPWWASMQGTGPNLSPAAWQEARTIPGPMKVDPHRR